MKTLYVALVASLLFLTNGCVVEHHHNGDISFDWGFLDTDGHTYSCSDPYIDVRTVYIEITDITDGINKLEYTSEQPCDAVGITVHNFVPGDYEIYLEGTSSYDNRTYAGIYYKTVYAGTNDYGTLVLDYIE